MRCGMIGTIFIAVCIYRNVFSLWQLSVYHPADGDIVLQSLPHGKWWMPSKVLPAHPGPIAESSSMNTIVGLSRKPSSTFARRFCPFGLCEGAEDISRPIAQRFPFPRATNHFEAAS